MHNVRFTRLAREELMAAYDWYEGESTGLGRRFLQQVDTTVNRIATDPLLFTTIYKQIRRALLHQFPYALFFISEADDPVTVIACFHSSRDPQEWMRRS